MVALAGALRPSARLKQLDRIARRIFGKNLQAAIALDNLIAKLDAAGFQRLDGRGEVSHLDLNPVPAAGRGAPSVGHALSRTARARLVQQQAKLAARQRRKARRWMHVHLEAQGFGVKSDGRLNVVDDVSNA